MLQEVYLALSAILYVCLTCYERFVVESFFLNCVDASKHSTSVNVRDQKVDKANQQRLAKQVALLTEKV